MRRLLAILGFSAATLGVVAAQQTLVNGAGAGFPYPLYSKWFDEYRKKATAVQFNYQSIGSGGGIRQVTEGTVDFGATEGPMTDQQISDFRRKRGSGILHFPTALGAVVVVYNIKGVNQPLNLSGEALTGIFLGKIRRWNDGEIGKTNPGVQLPDANIVVVRRSDGSGTTFVFTDYLSKVSKEWEMKVGHATSVNWPVGLGGKGNEGVTGQVQQTPNSIGYTELVYALQNKIAYAKVKNIAGKYVQADLKSVTEAAASAKQIPADFRVSITNAPGDGAYPISSFTWLLIPEKIADATKKKALKDFLKWMLNEGQSIAETLNYASLPKALIANELKAVDKIQ